jgi:hypothetical protein
MSRFAPWVFGAIMARTAAARTTATCTPPIPRAVLAIQRARGTVPARHLTTSAEPVTITTHAAAHDLAVTLRACCGMCAVAVRPLHPVCFWPWLGF